EGKIIGDGSVDDMTAGLQRKLSSQWIGDTDPFDWAVAAGLEPKQLDYDADWQRIRVNTSDTGQIAEQLLSPNQTRQLPSGQRGIEEASFHFTQPSTWQEAAS